MLAIVVFLMQVFVDLANSDQDFALRTVEDVPIAALFVFAVISGALYWRRRRPLIVP